MLIVFISTHRKLLLYKFMEYTGAYQALKSFVADQVDLNWFLDCIHNYNFLESNKSTAYDFLKQNGIPIPESQKFNDLQQLRKLLQQPVPYVVKFDTAITLGTQTVVVRTSKDAMSVLLTADKLKVTTGLVQRFVSGYEFTVTVLVGAHNWVQIGTAQDYKKQFENNQGANTFGMGSLSPAPHTHSQADLWINNIVQLLRQHHDYRGFLSCQFIANTNGIWLLEYNTRFCDPELQSMLELLDQSFVQSLTQCQQNNFMQAPVIDMSKRAVTVSLVHQDWPKHVNGQTLDLQSDQYRLWRNQHTNCVWWGTVTNAGNQSYQQLADQLYQWLRTQSLGPFRYRTDIGRVYPQTS